MANDDQAHIDFIDQNTQDLVCAIVRRLEDSIELTITIEHGNDISACLPRNIAAALAQSLLQASGASEDA
jgi:hypothetical protein